MSAILRRQTQISFSMKQESYKKENMKSINQQRNEVHKYCPIHKCINAPIMFVFNFQPERNQILEIAV